MIVIPIVEIGNTVMRTCVPNYEYVPVIYLPNEFSVHNINERCTNMNVKGGYQK